MLDASQFPFMQSNYKVKKFILEYENEEIKDLLNKCLYISEIILDGIARITVQAAYFAIYYQ
jgi:hypothetical protein